MRGLRVLAPAMSVLALAFLAAACTTVHQVAVQPSSNDIAAAVKFLQTTKPSDADHSKDPRAWARSRTWVRGVVLSTQYDKDVSGQSWSMNFLRASDSKVLLVQSADMSLPDQINATVAPGDYVDYVDDGDLSITEDEIGVIKKAAVHITGSWATTKSSPAPVTTIPKPTP